MQCPLCEEPLQNLTALVDHLHNRHDWCDILCKEACSESKGPGVTCLICRERVALYADFDWGNYVHHIEIRHSEAQLMKAIVLKFMGGYQVRKRSSGWLTTWMLAAVSKSI